jgi:DNA modification methylase
MAKQKPLSWITEKRKVSDLIAYEKNPRTLSEEQKEQLAESFRRFNYVELVAINTDGTIISGNQRVKILNYLDRSDEEIEVRTPNRKLTKKEFEEYLLRANKNTGSWDHSLLQEFDTEFLLDIGFNNDDLIQWDDVLDLEDDEFNVQESLEGNKETNIKEGDYFQLGKHFLLCGDSTDPDVARKVVGEHRVDFSYTDIPYNINLDYSGGVSKKKSYGGTTDDDLSEENYQQFIRLLLSNTLLVSKPDAHHFMWSDTSYTWMIQLLYKELGIKYQRTCLWIKNNANMTPQIAFSKCYENVIYGITGKPYLADKQTKFAEILNPEVGTGNATLDDIADMIDIWLVKRDPTNLYEHPTQKNVNLHERPLLRCTKLGDHVLDLCGGSGSTLIACEQLKRKAFLVEKEPIFCQVILDRYEQFTGNKANKLN